MSSPFLLQRIIAQTEASRRGLNQKDSHWISREDEGSPRLREYKDQSAI